MDRERTGLVGVGVLIGGLLGIWLWGSMLMAPWKLATGLLDAREHLRLAQKSLSKTQLKVARYETLAAAGAVDRAREGLRDGGPALDLLRSISVVDNALKEVPHLIAAADHSAKAALGTLNVAQDSLRGPRAVVVEDPDDPKGKKIDLERLQELAATITDVRAEISASKEELQAVDLDNLPERVHDGILDGIETATEADKTLRDAEAGLKILPGVLGADGPRTYMLGFQNSAEQRGTGGALLNFGLMQIADGSPELSEDAGSVYNVDKDRQQISIPLPPDAWYVANIVDAQRFGNANWSPDWPLSAQITMDYAQASAPEFPEMDGVIAVDPVLMEKLMPGVGPFTVANRSITSKRIVDFMLYRAYASWPIAGQRRVVLKQVVDKFYEGLFAPAKPTDLLGGFGGALTQKHVQIWMADPLEQRFIERMDWDGAITPPDELEDDDYIYVVEQNVGGSKLDYFDTNVNTMEVTFEGNDALVSTEMRVRNGVFLPQPRYSMGDSQTPNACAAARCPVHRPMLNLYVRDDAELISAEVSGDDVTRIDAPPSVATWSGDMPPTHFELGKKVWSGTLQIPPQAEGAITYRYRVPAVLQERGGRSVYRLHVQHQPKVRPETLIVRIRLPEGASGIKAKGWERDGGFLVWENELLTDQILEVSWRK
ncbi:MAG: DUF4012 domain-containing protein [Actinomycetota bacterium]